MSLDRRTFLKHALVLATSTAIVKAVPFELVETGKLTIVIHKWFRTASNMPKCEVIPVILDIPSYILKSYPRTLQFISEDEECRRRMTRAVECRTFQHAIIDIPTV